MVPRSKSALAIEIAKRVAIRRILSLGTWKEVRDAEEGDPWPTSAKVTNPRLGYRYLANRMKLVTMGKITMELGDVAISRTHSNDT